MQILSKCLSLIVSMATEMLNFLLSNSLDSGERCGHGPLFFFKTSSCLELCIAFQLQNTS